MTVPPASALAALALLTLAAGCTQPGAVGIDIVHIEVQNQSSAPVSLHVTLDNPHGLKVIDKQADVAPGKSMQWQSGAEDGLPPTGRAWHVDLDGTSRNRTLLSDAEGQSGAAWVIKDSLCAGPEFWIRFVARDWQSSKIEILNSRYGMLDGGSMSCDGIHWTVPPTPGGWT